MPTAAKLISALAFAAIGFLAAELFKPALPEGTQFGLFSEISAVLGVLVGWKVMGTLTGQGYVAAFGSGMRTSVTLVFLAMIGFSVYEMVLRSMKFRYDGPVEAILGAFHLFMEYGKLMGRPDFLAVLLIGGALAGALAEWAGRRWR
jgi:hypothetical protein